MFEITIVSRQREITEALNVCQEKSGTSGSAALSLHRASDELPEFKSFNL